MFWQLLHLLIFLISHKKVFEIIVELKTLLLLFCAKIENNLINSSSNVFNIYLINSPGIQFSSNLNFDFLKYMNSFN